MASVERTETPTLPNKSQKVCRHSGATNQLKIAYDTNTDGTHRGHEVPDWQAVRQHIPGDYEVPMFLTSGKDRQRLLFVYSMLMSYAMFGVIYCWFRNPVLQTLNIILAYFLDNMAFFLGHLVLHASFIELPENEMSVLTHHSFIHHYRDIQCYHKTWLESRMSYFLDPKDFVKGELFSSPACQNMPLWKRFMPMGGTKPDTHTLAYLILMPVSAALLSPTNMSMVSATSSAVLMHSLQATVHEWYHNPSSNKKQFYWAPVYYLFQLLEFVGIASTKRHKDHHAHDLDNLHEVVEWTDMWSIGFETISTWIWNKAIPLYRKGERNMFRYTQKVRTFGSSAMFYGTLWGFQWVMRACAIV